jgi:hypothetical protein
MEKLEHVMRVYGNCFARANGFAKANGFAWVLLTRATSLRGSSTILVTRGVIDRNEISIVNVHSL